MNIGIVGNYGNNNNGDEAILLGIITQLTANFDIQREQITVFSNNPEQTQERYGVKSFPLYYKKGSAPKTFLETVKQSRKYIKDLDVVIIGGGGILMDLYKREAPLYGTYGLMGKQAGAKVVVYGCGAGPLTSSIGKFFIKRLAKAADSISVRDPESKALLQSVGINKDIQIIGDPAFTLTTVNKHKKSESIKKVGVTAVPYYNIKYWPEADEAKYQAYVTGMARNLDQLIEKKGVEVTFFSTKYPQDVWVTKDIYEAMEHKENAVMNEEHLSPAQLIDVCGEQDVVIGTRLHSIILSLDAETPVIGVAYHHKVKHFMQMIGKEDQCLSMDELSSDPMQFSAIIERMDSEWDAVQQEAEAISSSLKAKAAKGLDQFHMLPKKRG
ncbi:polysaccharide pyruvyl transferase family protein [Cytobacillus massiliigabonensis]|uniref:polysaccharide pyruvyl transferase family protein n=1 Tax=Cytobacillus massiliigabonensis TaxID=1871011 RepID=UPI000C85D36C|nr:polysaccharide pyruvyl transferase family protein [Cytobacillus massiliigabonensis]